MLQGLRFVPRPPGPQRGRRASQTTGVWNRCRVRANHHMNRNAGTSPTAQSTPGSRCRGAERSQIVSTYGAGGSNLGTVRSIAVGADGTVYVADGTHKLIAEYTANGTIDVDSSGKIYIGDTGNHRVKVFTP
jgi:hypothetical protein